MPKNNGLLKTILLFIPINLMLMWGFMNLAVFLAFTNKGLIEIWAWPIGAALPVIALTSEVIAKVTTLPYTRVLIIAVVEFFLMLLYPLVMTGGISVI